MTDIEKKRVAMLAVAGALLGATIFGWARHMDSTSAGRELGSRVAAAPAPADVPTATAQATTNAPTTASAQNAAPQVSAVSGGMIPASKSVEVESIVRRSAGRANPMAAIDYVFAADGRRYRQSGQAGVDVPLPPPPDPTVSSVGQRHPYYAPQRPAAPPPLKEAIQLVGVMDGKAIFTVPDDVAAEHGMTPSFTLGQGQKYGGITVEEIKTHSVTISDGKSICTKELSSIN